VYCGADDGTFAALSVRDGSVKWTFRAGAPIQASPAIQGGLVVFGAHDHNVYALDRHTGRKLWNFTARGSFVQAPPVIADGRVYAAQWHDWVWALDANTGEPLWQSFVPISIEAVARHGEKLYVRSPYYVAELDPATGKRLRIGEASYGYGGLAFHGARVFQSGIRGQYGTTGLTRIDLEGATRPPVDHPTMNDVVRFTPRSLSQRLASMATPLAAADDRLCLATLQGQLVLTDLDGKVLWEKNLDSMLHAAPIAASGMVLVGADDGRLYAFRSAPAAN
jgi:outer membrane protein assembly factor BamB